MKRRRPARHRGRRLGAAAAVALAACASPSPDAPAPRIGLGFVEGAPRASGPMIVALHGPEGAPGRFARLAAFTLGEKGWAVLFPATDAAGWMDPALPPTEALAAFIEDLVASGRADPARIYVAGFSDGGQAALLLACTRPELVAGVAAVMASLPEGAPCPPGEPVPILLVNALADPVMPFDGGPVARPASPGLAATVRLAGPVSGALDTAAILSRRNRCAAAREVEIPDLDPSDGTRVVQRVYDGCAAPTTQFVVEGGGHAWPGARVGSRIRSALGAPSIDISATVEIEDFFGRIDARR